MRRRAIGGASSSVATTLAFANIRCALVQHCQDFLTFVVDMEMILAVVPTHTSNMMITACIFQDLNDFFRVLPYTYEFEKKY